MTLNVPYRLPNWVFPFAVFPMILLTDISFVHGSDWSKEDNMDPTTLAGFYYAVVLRSFYELGIVLFIHPEVITMVCVGAHLAHFCEATYVAFLCMWHELPVTSTLLYVLGTSLGGYTQIATFKAEVAKAQRATLKQK